MELDCGFTRENNWFRYRAAAIIVENNCVLLAGNEREDYFYSVGGGVHLNEKAEEKSCFFFIFLNDGARMFKNLES